MLRTIVSLLGLPLLLFSCASNEQPHQTLFAIKNVQIITMEREAILSNQSILIDGNKIALIGPSDSIQIPEDANIIDGQGKFLIPGLCDMHMHIDHPDVLPLNLAYGVTTVMNYRGLSEHLILKKRSQLNQIISPNIYTTGDYMEGYPATFPAYLSFDKPEDARISVGLQKQLGYDFIKVYRNLDTLMHLAICEEAKKNDMGVVGHLSPDISLEQSFKAGQKVVAHLEEVMYFFNNENDLSKVDDLIALFLKYDVTFTPNLGIFKSIIQQVQAIDSLNAQPHLKYLHPVLYQSWRKENNRNHSRGPEFGSFMKKRFLFLQKVCSRMHQAGVRIMSSTDAPTAAAFPGLSVHQELQEFTAIGLTPYEALQTATAIPGGFMAQNLKDSIPFGLIKEGYRADFLLLENNPLTDVKNTTSILGVMKNGHWYTTDFLQNGLNELAQSYTPLDSLVISIESDIKNGNVEEAYETFEKVMEKDSSALLLGYYTTAYWGYQYLYQNRKLTTDSVQAKKASMLYEMYARNYPEMHGSYYFQGLAAKAQQDTLQALEHFNRSLSLHPSNPYAKKAIKDLQ